MARYITLLTYTDQAARNIKDSIARARQFEALTAKSDVRVAAQYWTFGHVDGVLVLEADREEQIFQLLDTLGAMGNVQTQTMKAFVDHELDSIVSGALRRRPAATMENAGLPMAAMG